MGKDTTDWSAGNNENHSENLGSKIIITIY